MGFIHDRLEVAGHRVDYCCAEDLPSRWGGRLARFAFPILVAQRAREAARAGRPYDIVNVHEPSSAAIALLKSKVGHPKVVVTSHGVEQRAWELACQERRLGRQGPSVVARLTFPWTTLWQCRVGLTNADHVLCLNRQDRDYLVRRLRLPPGRITRICPGVSPNYGESAVTRDYGRWDRLLFAGTWRKNKGIEDMVPAFGELADRYPSLTLTVLDAGGAEPTIRAAFPERLRSRVSCIRTADEAQNAAIYSGTDILVLPSLFEGTPLTLLEGMAAGMPIVTTATAGMRDVIRHRETGLLIPLRSPQAIVAALASLIDSHALREQLGHAAHAEVIQDYTWDKAAESVRLVYEATVFDGQMYQ